MKVVKRKLKNDHYRKRTKKMEHSLRCQIGDREESNFPHKNFQDIALELESEFKKEQEQPFEMLLNSISETSADTRIKPIASESLNKARKEHVANDTANLMNETNKDLTINNIFKKHFSHELSSEALENLLQKQPVVNSYFLQWPESGKIQVTTCCDNIESLENIIPAPITNTEDLISAGVHQTLASNATFPLSQLQSEFLHMLNFYRDIFYSRSTIERTKDIQNVYCLHVLNHILMTRSSILNNTAKIKALKLEGADFPDAFLDQGLVRPKVLILVPFRSSAYRVVKTMQRLLYGEQKENEKSTESVMNIKRFTEEYTGNNISFSKTNPKPDDYVNIFSGNTDDNFCIGLSITKKSLKLYTKALASDIIIASPLGLRLLINRSDGELFYDFLNSIEILIIDQAEIFLAQNWDNLLYVLDHLHLQPQDLKSMDLLRARKWCVSGLSRFYRQTVLLASHELPEFSALFNRKCCNYRGKLRLVYPLDGDIYNVIVPISQAFIKIDVSSLETLCNARFEYFVDKILPRFKSTLYSHCMIYIPNYFDFVRLRNYFKENSINFVQICEYTKKEKIARARDMFFHSGAHFLLYSERSHFFRRTRIKGIRNLIMYSLPNWPNFYSEIVNLMQESNQNARDGLNGSMSTTALYSKFDQLHLNYVLGSKNTKTILNSEKTVHTYLTG